MPVYNRTRLFWGAFDMTTLVASTPGYTPTQIVTGGPSAQVGSGVGVRRVSIIIDRTGVMAGSDAAMIHFDFLNYTGGSPDDTWTPGDYTTLEALINTWMTAVASLIPIGNKFTTLIWHRVGTGVPKPNPAERILTLATPINGAGGSSQPPQSATSITFRTGVRKSWGRTYLPWGLSYGATGVLAGATVDSVASLTNTLVTNAAASDFQLVVVSKPLASALAVESVECDNVGDVIRRRRWKRSTYKKILP